MGLIRTLRRHFSPPSRPLPEQEPAFGETVPIEGARPDGETTWRQVLDESWDEKRRTRDWKGIRGVHNYVALLMTGRRENQRGHWATWTLDHHLAPLRKTLGRDLTMASFGCGPGGIEEWILRNARWPLSAITLYEYDEALLAEARRKLAPLPVKSEFHTFDFNAPPAADRVFDVVFFCHSLHHCTDLERFLPFLNRIVAPGGLILGLDYFGPPRLQMDLDARRLANEIFACLPEHLRTNLGDETPGVVDKRLRIQTIADVATYDPSEAPRSADLRSMLFSAFDVVEIRPMGGTLLRNLLANRAGNFRSEGDHAILHLMMMIERLAIETRTVASDDLYFVIRPTDRI